MNAVKQPLRPVLPGKGTLLRALSHAFGNEHDAREFLRSVLWDAAMDAVPESAPGFETFVREEVLPRLMPLVRLERINDLVRRTIGEEGSMYPPPLKAYGAAPGAAASPAAGVRPRVVIVEPDAFRRIAQSRELVRGGFDVEVVATAEEVLRVEAFHAVVMMLDEGGLKIARELAKRGTRAGLVLYEDPKMRDALKVIIDAWPNDRVSVVARDAAPSVLTSRVRIVTS